LYDQCGAAQLKAVGRPKEKPTLCKKNYPQFIITKYKSDDQSQVRNILERIGWDEPYVIAFEQPAVHFSNNNETAAVFIARHDDRAIGFIFIEYHPWHRLSQIQGLAVDPEYHRRGVASALVMKAELFAREHNSRGVYVDTPMTNDRGRRLYESIGYKVGYIMPKYYEDKLDGVTYQKFFDEDNPND
jgi:ribosomal protein S18 acetylase RimI-like enzyme